MLPKTIVNQNRVKSKTNRHIKPKIWVNTRRNQIDEETEKIKPGAKKIRGRREINIENKEPEVNDEAEDS